MIVGNRKKFTLPVQYPPFTVSHLALGAMAIAAAIITDRLYATVFTNCHMASQSFGPAQGYSLQGLFYLHGWIVLLLKTGTMKTDNIGYFILRLQDFGG